MKSAGTAAYTKWDHKRDEDISDKLKIKPVILDMEGRRGQNEYRKSSKTNFKFSPHHRVQTGSGAHPASYPIGTRGSLSLGVKRPGREADHSLPSSAVVKECVELYLHT
jgi:hypothetical protein